MTINAQLHYLWRAVDQDGEFIDILVQKHKDKKAALNFLKKLLKTQEEVPFELITDKLKSYGAAKKEIISSVLHTQDRYANNQAEKSHQSTLQKEKNARV